MLANLQLSRCQCIRVGIEKNALAVLPGEKQAYISTKRLSTKGHHVGKCLSNDGNLSFLWIQEAMVTPTQDSLSSAEISPEREHNLSEMRICFY